jgi:uncharacterized membrane protein
MDFLFKFIKSVRLFRITIFLLIFVWYLGLSFPIVFSSSGLYVLTPFIKKIYSNVCHQAAYKCMFFGGQQFLVCSRCLGIYTGMLIFSGFSIFLKLNLKNLIFLLALSIAFMLIDILLYNIGLYNYSQYIAFGTGLFFGSVTFIYILNEFENYLLTFTPFHEK